MLRTLLYDLLGHFFLFVAACLRVIVFDYDTVLKLSSFYVLQALSLDDVLEASLVAIALQFLQKEQFVALQLLYSLVQSRYRLEHLVVLSLELGLFRIGLGHLLLHDRDLILEFTIVGLFLVEVLFDVGASSYGFHGQLHGLSFILL